MSSPNGGLLLALGAAFFAALTALFSKLGTSMHPAWATFFRTLVVLVITAGLALRHPLAWGQETQKGLLYLLASGIATALSWACYFQALSLQETTRVAALDRLSIVFTLLFACLWLGETLTWQKGFGATMMAIGAILMSLA
jgi:transporter family protein